MMNTLSIVSIVSISVGVLSALIILIDILRGYAQHMMVMNFVWPITGLYAGPLALWAYFRLGRPMSHRAMKKMKPMKEEQHHAQLHPKMKRPFAQSVIIGALHCGSGCTLGDVLAESALLAYPVVILGSRLYGAWVVDFIFAFFLGIVFQYYSIKPMRQLSPRRALVAALKADTLSLTAWQIGMYGGMAIATFIIFHHRLEASTPLFWMVMQVSMLLGFCTAYPVNWWLLKMGIKEVM